jgi:hypothetical protein
MTAGSVRSVIKILHSLTPRYIVYKMLRSPIVSAARAATHRPIASSSSLIQPSAALAHASYATTSTVGSALVQGATKLIEVVLSANIASHHATKQAEGRY